MSMYNLGILFREGRGVKRDFITAADWIQRAARAGNGYAQTTLGEMYELGEGVSKDFPMAAKWYERAAQQGITVAQLQLSILHGTGQLGKRDLVQSYKWVLLAAHLGHEKTGELRDLLDKEMSDAERAEAIRLARSYRPEPVFEEVRPLE